MSTTTVVLPTLHAGQVEAYKLKADARGGEWDKNAGGKAKAIRFSTLAAICAALKCQPGDLLEFVKDK